mmetsp:Transcript_98856/g.268481  ORF Transcript_98856/g.268481 Transcript_98856/m.268481 type:complete len:248 (-) Transcript_98856:485-1228(-)
MWESCGRARRSPPRGAGPRGRRSADGAACRRRLAASRPAGQYPRAERRPPPAVSSPPSWPWRPRPPLSAAGASQAPPPAARAPGPRASRAQARRLGWGPWPLSWRPSGVGGRWERWATPTGLSRVPATPTGLSGAPAIPSILRRRRCRARRPRRSPIAATIPARQGSWRTQVRSDCLRQRERSRRDFSWAASLRRSQVVAPAAVPTASRRWGGRWRAARRCRWGRRQTSRAITLLSCRRRWNATPVC